MLYVWGMKTVEELQSVDKCCKRCKVVKSGTHFRIRTESRRGCNFKYLNYTCRECDSILQRERWNTIKYLPEEIAKNRTRSKQYREKNKEAILEKEKLRRQTESYKENRRKYIERNKEKIFSQEEICKKRYSKYHMENITDKYAFSLLRAQGVIDKDSAKKYPEIIELKKAQLLLHREIKKIKK